MRVGGEQTALGGVLAAVVWLILPAWVVGCGEDPTSAEPLADFSVAGDLTAQIVTWRLDRPAAMTIAFDDARPCNYEIIAPALEERGFCGTFNINTGAVGSNWQPYIEMAERGHELGNHTRNHYNLRDLPLEEARREIERGREDLLANVPGLADVMTFTYPEGASNIDLRAIALEEHISARGHWGWNLASPEDYSMIRGRAYDDLSQIMDDVRRAISTRTWLVAYFHAVGPRGIPEDEFGHYLDHVAAWKDSLWVATQGEIAKYTLERDDCIVQLSGGNPGLLTLETSLDPARFNVPLSLCLTATCAEVDFLLVDDAICPLSECRRVWVEIAPGDTVTLEGKDLSH